MLLAVVKKATWEWIEELEEELSGKNGFRQEDQGAKGQLKKAMDAYLALAAIHRRNQRFHDAQQALQTGIDYFDSTVERYLPRFDDMVDSDFNEKAEEVYEDYKTAAQVLRQRVEVIDERLSALADRAR